MFGPEISVPDSGVGFIGPTFYTGVLAGGRGGGYFTVPINIHRPIATCSNCNPCHFPSFPIPACMYGSCVPDYLQNLHQPRNHIIYLYCPELSNLGSKGHPPTYEKMQKKLEEEEKKVDALKSKYEEIQKRSTVVRHLINSVHFPPTGREICKCS